jgi:hypothetical protein
VAGCGLPSALNGRSTAKVAVAGGTQSVPSLLTSLGNGPRHSINPEAILYNEKWIYSRRNPAPVSGNSRNSRERDVGQICRAGEMTLTDHADVREWLKSEACLRILFQWIIGGRHLASSLGDFRRSKGIRFEVTGRLQMPFVARSLGGQCPLQTPFNRRAGATRRVRSLASPPFQIKKRPWI